MYEFSRATEIVTWRFLIGFHLGLSCQRSSRTEENGSDFLRFSFFPVLVSIVCRDGEIAKFDEIEICSQYSFSEQLQHINYFRTYKMKIITPAVLALGSVPVYANAWSVGPSYFSSQCSIPPSLAVNIMQRRQALANRLLKDFKETQLDSPRYELIDSDEKFQLSVDVPGVKVDDIDVSLEDGYLTVAGQRMTSDDSSRFTSKFSQTFSLDPAVDVEQFSASLNDGVLVVMAPKDFKRVEESITKIPIMQDTAEGKQPELQQSKEKADAGDTDILNLDNDEGETSGDDKLEDLTA
jgi:HSP20 family protein